MTMTSRAALTAAVLLLAACSPSPGAPAGTPSTTSTVTVSSTPTSPAAPTGAVAREAAQALWAAALAPLERAQTSAYTVTSTLSEVRRTLVYRVDERRALMPTPAAIDSVPDVVAAFIPTSSRVEGATTYVDGTVGTQAGLQAVGLADMAKDAAFADSLTGQWAATARIDGAGRLVGIDVRGKGATVTAKHSKYTPAQVAALLAAAEGHLAIDSLDRPVTVTVPDVAHILPAT